MSDWIQVYTGGRFYPLEPRAEDVDIRDIAHALSMICRFNGHTKRFYSVAEHCWLLWSEVRRLHPQDHEQQLMALLHDASEAYLCDVPRPVKPFLTGYKDAESAVEKVIAARFGLPGWGKATPLIGELDDRILVNEAEALMPVESIAWHKRFGEPLPFQVLALSPEDIEQRYLLAFRLSDSGRRALAQEPRP